MHTNGTQKNPRKYFLVNFIFCRTRLETVNNIINSKVSKKKSFDQIKKKTITKSNKNPQKYPFKSTPSLQRYGKIVYN